MARFIALARAALALSLAVPASFAAAQTNGFNPALPLVHVDNGPNSAAAQNRHYIVVVSLDGFRWDFAKRENATHLLALGKEGVWAPEGMLPSYPSLTFPNHFTIVTGLYPEHHGLVANNFFDPDRQKRYSISDLEAVKDGSWYSGTPLWSLAESQGMRTACIFWPGSEARIAGYRPTWYAEFNPSTQATAKVQQARIEDATALLHLPAEQRPHLILMYFSEPDHEGHQYGPDAPETRAAELKMDALVGKLKTALDATGLAIDLVVVSDHGMAHVQNEWITQLAAAITQAWAWPPGTDPKTKAWLKIRLSATGQVLSADISTPSGIPLFDQTLKQAAYKASPLPLPRDPSAFDPNLTICFSPNQQVCNQ